MRMMQESVNQEADAAACQVADAGDPGSPGKGHLWRPWIACVLIGLLVLALVLLPMVADPYTLSLLYTLFLYLALAQSWNLLGGYSGLISFGNAAFFGLGAYTTAILVTASATPFFVAMLVGGLVAAIFAVIVALPIFRFRGIYFAIGTLVLAEALHLWMINWSLVGGAQGMNLPVNDAPDAFGFYYMALAIAATTTALLALILRSRLGLGLRAIRDNEDVAQNMGVNTFRIKLFAFAISAFITGLVGGMHAVYLGTIEPYSIFSLNWTISAVNIVIIGGAGTLIGPVIGSVFVTWLAESLADYPTLHLMITGLIMILLILFLPAGIWGSLARSSLPSRIAKKIRIRRRKSGHVARA